MVTQLSDEQRMALEREPRGPIYVDDPLNHTRYVLIPAESYDRLRTLMTADEFDISETYAAQDEALGMAGWNDPVMDAYNDYDSNRPQL
jgi:hypothetical protein